jgi:hypothetical protein
MMWKAGVEERCRPGRSPVKIMLSAEMQQRRAATPVVRTTPARRGTLELARSPAPPAEVSPAFSPCKRSLTTPSSSPRSRAPPRAAPRLTPSASPHPPHYSRLHRPASPNPPHRSRVGGCTEPRRRGQVRYTGVHVSGESLVPLGSGGMPHGMRRFPLSFYRISRPADTVAPGPGAFGCGQSPRSRPTRFRTPGELLSKSVPFENHVGNLAGRSAADVCYKDTPGHRGRQAFRRMG